MQANFKEIVVTCNIIVFLTLQALDFINQYVELENRLRETVFIIYFYRLITHV